PDAGQVVMRKGIRMEFLSQEPALQDELTIEENIFASDNDILKVIERYEKALENIDDQDEYQKAFEQMDIYNAWDFETQRSEEHTSELQSRENLVCRLLLEKKK